jgi:hypothetical protein
LRVHPDAVKTKLIRCRLLRGDFPRSAIKARHYAAMVKSAESSIRVEGARSFAVSDQIAACVSRLKKAATRRLSYPTPGISRRLLGLNDRGQQFSTFGQRALHHLVVDDDAGDDEAGDDEAGDLHSVANVADVL